MGFGAYLFARSVQRAVWRHFRTKARIAELDARAVAAKAKFDHEVTPRQQRALALENQHVVQTKEHNRAYRFARDAMLDVLDAGIVADTYGLQQMRTAMAKIAPVKQTFGERYYAELRDLLDRVECLPVQPPNAAYVKNSSMTGSVLLFVVLALGALLMFYGSVVLR
jgi:hypothetical protein